MRILITGASGMLGTAIKHELELSVLGHEIITTDIAVLDVTRYHHVQSFLGHRNPDLVIHLAAETDVDRCELDPDHAYLTNTMGTENVAIACKEMGCTMVYVSTAGVFSGTKETPYTEFDYPGPRNVYGKSKLWGEYYVVDHMRSNYFIIRAGWMVGGWDIDKKFVRKIVDLTKTEPQLNVVNDKFGSMTFTRDFSKNLMNVVMSGRYGLYHMTNKGTASRYEVAQEIVRLLGTKIKVHPVPSSFFNLPAPRANSEMMRNFKLEKLGLNNMPHWSESLREYIRENTTGGETEVLAASRG